MATLTNCNREQADITHLLHACVCVCVCFVHRCASITLIYGHCNDLEINANWRFYDLLNGD